MVNTVTAYVKTLDVRYDGLRAALEQYSITLPEIDLGKNDLLTKITDLVAKGGSALLNTTIGVTTSVLSAVVNLLMGVVFSVYILAQKETLGRQIKRVLYALFPESGSRRFWRSWAASAAPSPSLSPARPSRPSSWARWYSWGC